MDDVNVSVEITSLNNNESTVLNKNNEGFADEKEIEIKLPPVSTISNSSFLWDPDVDGEMVNLPIAPQVHFFLISKKKITSLFISF